MNIVKYLPGQAYGNMYGLEENNHLIFIDPGIVDIDLAGRTLDYILLTHEHYDHISGVNYWKEKTGAKVICSEACSRGLADPAVNLSCTFQQFCAIQSVRNIDLASIQNVDYVCQADVTYEKDYKLQWERHAIEFFILPGHSKGGSGILVDNSSLFAGDSLLRDYATAGCFVGSSGTDWQEVSLPRLKLLPKNLHVYPGHFEDFLLRDYRFWNEGRFRRERRK